MSWNERLYDLMVNRIPGIRIRYQRYRKKCTGRKRLLAWLFLLKLNFEFYFLKKKDLSESLELNPDYGKAVPQEPESSLAGRESPELLAEKLSHFDVVSFDVFDTLLVRKVNLPEDVFYLLQNQTGYPDLKRLRAEAEYFARKKRKEEEGDAEVNLEEIWQVLEETTGINTSEGMEIEWKSETAVCEANPYFLQVIILLKEMDIKLIVCSDMYLGEKRICRLLRKCGYPDFSGCFVSCDRRVSKNTGELYDLIRSEYGEDKSYVHVGDNFFSDVKQAKTHGFTAVHYPSVRDLGGQYRARDMSPVIFSVYSGIVNNYLYNGTNTLTEAFEFGFIYGGLFVTGFCQYIHDYVKNEHMDKILFLSRDGDILNKVYRCLYPEDAFRCEYVYWSRLVSAKLCAGSYRSFFMERMILHKVNQKYTLKSIFCTMELEDMLDEYLGLSEYNINGDNILDDRIAGELIRFLTRNWERVCEHYKKEYSEAKNYYSRILKEAKKAVVVDVGWVGSGALTLKRLIETEWKFSCEVYGIVAGICGAGSNDHEATDIEFASGCLNSYLFSASENRDFWKKHDAAKGHNMVVELLLSSPEFSFRGFQKDKEGRYSFNKSREKINAEEIQRGIVTFAKLYKNHPFGRMKISGRDASAPIGLLYEDVKYVKRLLEFSEIEPNIE